MVEVACYECPFACKKGLNYEMNVEEVGRVDVTILKTSEQMVPTVKNPDGKPIVQSAGDSFRAAYNRRIPNMHPGELITTMTSGICPISKYSVDIYITKVV